MLNRQCRKVSVRHQIAAQVARHNEVTKDLRVPLARTCTQVASASSQSARRCCTGAGEAVILLPGCQTAGKNQVLLAAADEIFSASAEQVVPVDTAAAVIACNRERAERPIAGVNAMIAVH